MSSSIHNQGINHRDTSHCDPSHCRMVAAACRWAGGLAISVAAIIASGSLQAGAEAPPPWTHCAYADHPAAADLGPLLPTHHRPSAGVRAVLLGDVVVGTDCSIYELPV